MTSTYDKQLHDLSVGVFILSELLFRLDIYSMYPTTYQLNRVTEYLEEWKKHYPLIKDIKLRFWEFGDKRYLMKELRLYRRSIVDCIDYEQAKEYHLL